MTRRRGRRGAPAHAEAPAVPADPPAIPAAVPVAATVSPASENINRAVRRMTNSWGAKGLNDTSDWY